MKNITLPDDRLSLKNFKINGHAVDFQGRQALAFRVDQTGRLVAFCGVGSDRITIDGQTTVYADKPLSMVAWAPVEERRRVEGGAVIQIFVRGKGTVRIPIDDSLSAFHVVAQGPTPGSRGPIIKTRVEKGAIVLPQKGSPAARWYYVVPGVPSETKN